ncbi:reverse ribonuclease integrase [Lasius niger]|uniref:RNA-directed DNA polymerase n=1 Tax=Lasius niger TaxID=67767 RepID=A0A0J7K129_LASNI|nr:reverse ribonuclease integrase [Lasius niger]
MSRQKKEILEKEINVMLESDVIEECESPWATPVVLVPKKDGTTRICVDYRLNAVTNTDSYPMPRIDELLHLAKRTLYMSTIDLRSGYWQVSVKPEDRDKTAVTTPFGTFRFKRMPFGLKNSGATFQRLMDRFRKGLKDIVVKFLGHVITPEGIRPNEEKVAAILHLPPPRNMKHLLTFLQTASWFRRFVPGFAEIARPLTQLTKKDAAWTWAEDQKESFEKLKKLLTDALILRQADETLPLIIRTDASNYALGAYYRTRKFRRYIDGAKVVIGTDHQPLKWLMSLKSPSGCLARWALSLQEYNLKIIYTPGKVNVVADTLSRPPCTDKNEGDCEICTVVIDLPSEGAAKLREEQLSDPEVKKIIDAFETKDNPDVANWTSRGYLMTNGVLYRYSPMKETEEAQWVVPKCAIERILYENHDAPTAGHYGMDKTLRCISRLLMTPAASRRFETLAIDLFGPLPITVEGYQWIFIIEDVATKWVEIFPLKRATAETCARTLIDEVMLRYGISRRIISDHGPQFIGAVMQQVSYCLGFSQSLTPVYHPEANPVERKNRDMKVQLSILVENAHTKWADNCLP